MDQIFLNKKLSNGIKYLKSKNFKKAIKCFEYLLKDKKTETFGLLHIGITFIEQNQESLAINYFNRILEKDIQNEPANINLGLIYFRQKNYKKSINYFQRILNKNIKHLVANLHKAIIDYENLNFPSALNHFKICEKINKNIPQLQNYLGSIYFKKNEIDIAIKYYKSAILKNNNDARSKYNLSKCYFSKLLYKDALDLYENRLSFIVNSKADEVIKKFNPKPWSGESLDNKSICIISEQGIGDTIQFARYIFYIKKKFDCKIYFYVNKKYLHLFNNCPFNIISDLKNINTIDYYQYLMSLQRIYFKENNNFFKNINYINSNKDLDNVWKNKINKMKKPVIALNWQGNPKYAEDHLRSIPLEYFTKIVKNKKYNFISLQKGHGSDQIKNNNLSSYINDISYQIDLDGDVFVDTISILKNIDLLITTDTAIAHLAGTMEINTFLLLNYNPEWRWVIEINKKIFYNKKLSIIQQTKYNDWQSVVNKLNKKLDNFFNK